MRSLPIPRKIIPMPTRVKNRAQAPEHIRGAVAPTIRRRMPTIIAFLVSMIGVGSLGYFLNPILRQF